MRCVSGCKFNTVVFALHVILQALGILLARIHAHGQHMIIKDLHSGTVGFRTMRAASTCMILHDRAMVW